MDFSTICRTCITKSDLNPIFLTPEAQKRYSDAIYITTGLKVEPNDGLPQQMCINCLNFLNYSLKFRKQCKENEKLLLKRKSDLELVEKPNITFVEIISNTKNNSPGQKTRFKMELEDEILKNKKDTIEHFKTRNLKELLDTDFNKEDLEDSITDLKIEYLEDSPKELVEEYLEDLSEDELPLKFFTANYEREKSVDEVCHFEGNNFKNLLEIDKTETQDKILRRDGKVLRCGYCKTEFDNRQLLIDHVTACTAKAGIKKPRSDKELRECDICHKTMQKASLRLHKAVKHAGLRPVCEHCGRRFGNNFRLLEHCRAKHGYEQFRCTRCDFRTSRALALQNHERRHLGEKPFVCERCGAKFHAAYLLAQHRQSHRTHKLIKCDLCPATFKANNSLHMHKASCHSQTAFKCHLCDRAYRYRRCATGTGRLRTGDADSTTF